MSGIVWLALDGVGHPQDAPDGSVWAQPLGTLRRLVDAGRCLDATLGVPGLPQSGTGQACWLTGRDAVRVMGEHFGPHPGPTLQRLLREESLPVRLAQAGARVALGNEYVPAYVQALESGAGRRNRMGCFPFSFRAAGLALNPPGLPLLGATLGLPYARPWAGVPHEETALDALARHGAALARAATEVDLLALDLRFGDLLGPAGAPDVPGDALGAGRSYLRRVDALLSGLLGAGVRVVISSDHGNLEDLRTKGHTLAGVPFAGAGVDLGQPGNVVEAGRVLAGWFGLPGA